MNPSETVEIGPGAFADGDLEVINYKGENFYRSCPVRVTESTYCVKRVGHPGLLHEDYDGVVSTGIKEPTPIDYEPDLNCITKRQQALSVVSQAIGTASMCWDPKPSTEVFDSQMAKEVCEGLMRALEKIFQFDISNDLIAHDIGG